MGEEQLYIAGGKMKSVKFQKLKTNDPLILKMAVAYAKAKQKSTKKIVIQDAISGDFNRDGETDYFIAAGTGSTSETRTYSDFSFAFSSTSVGGKTKTSGLLWKDKFGEMQGPFRTAFLGVADFDGNGVNEVVMTTKDSWGIEALLLQMSKKGTTKQICYCGFGE